MWDVFKNFLFDILVYFHSYTHDWGAAILVVTFIIRLILSPLMHAATKSTYGMRKAQPKIKAIQEKFAGDQQKLAQEMQKLYAEAKFNPISGCLPLFLQAPIFIALYQVLTEMHDRLGNTHYGFYNLVPNLVLSPSMAIHDGFAVFTPYLILLIVFAFATFAPMVLMQIGQPNTQRTQMFLMAGFMTVFMLWVGWSSPAGVLLYWGTSSLVAVIQQQTSLYIMQKRDKENEENAAEPSNDVYVVRKERKKKPTKKA